MRSILILGASRYQVEAIRTARRLGYRTVACDTIPENPGHALVDRSHIVDTVDREAVLTVAEKETIDGVIASGTDVAVPTAAYVAERLGLAGPPLAAAEIACAKLAFRDFLRRSGLPTPAFLELPDESGALESAFDSGRHWVVKPDRSSGSKGVFIVRSRAELEARLPEALAFSPTGRAILEEFVEGFQGTCEGVLSRGTLAVAYLLDRHTVPPPYVATCGHLVPSSLPPETQHRVFDQVARVWRLLGVSEGVFDCDFVVAGDNVYILELSPRLGGNRITALLRESTGFDFVEYALRLACGDSPAAPAASDPQAMAVMILGSASAGRLSYDEAAACSLAETDWILSLSMDLAAGSRVRAFINGRERVGECFLRGSSQADVAAKTAEVDRRLRIRAS
jgi:biotin carboxylase